MKKITTMALLASLAFNTQAQEQKDTTADMVKAAMTSELRTADEIERDGNRLPVETLAFLGLEANMKVVELLPGGGWYTKLLAPVLREKGELVVAYGTSRVAGMIADNEAMSAVIVAAAESNIYRKEGARSYSIENAELGVKNADMVLTFRNYHNFAKDGRMEMNDAAWNALKEGGIYGVVDHTRRHMESDGPENGRRIDPVMAILEIQAAGFELVDYSTLHYRADDELRYEVGRKTVTGNTDRFTLKFKKVKK